MEKERKTLENQRSLGSGLYGKRDGEKHKAFSRFKCDGTNTKHSGSSCSKIFTQQLGFNLPGK